MNAYMDYDNIVSLIYEASYKPEYWEDVLAAITKLTESRSASLIYMHNGQPDASISITHNIRPEIVADYLETYGAMDPFFKLNEQAPIGVAKSDSQMVPDRKELEAMCGEYFTGFMQKHDHLHIGGATLFKDEECIAAIAVQRGQQQGPWPDECMDRLTKITPHMQRAFRIHTEFMRLRSREKALYTGLDNLMIGVILLDKNQKVTYINPVAESIMGQHKAIEAHGEHVRAFIHEEALSLSDIISKCSDYDGSINDECSYALGLHHPDENNPLPMLVTPVYNSDLTQYFRDPSIRVALFISDPESPSTISVKPLMEVYGVSETEASVAIAVANGSSLEDIAKLHDVSIHTIRNQLKSIYSKTNTTRQSQLVKLLLSGPFSAVSK